MEANELTRQGLVSVVDLQSIASDNDWLGH